MKVSVVIPAYNEEKHIAKALEHLLAQEERADEIIVVDNNSTDKTSKIAKKYGARVIEEKIQGMIPARNRGFNAANYEIIARTDADTNVPSYWIKKIKENFIKNKNLVGLSGTTHFYDFPIHNKFQHSQWQNKAIFAFIKSRIKHATLYGPNMAIRKNAWEKIKNEICLEDNAVHEDTDLAIHLGQHGDIKVDPMLVVNTSFRRWKKPRTYLEYSHRLLKTLRKHRLRKNSEIGFIDVLWKEFKTTNNVPKDTVIIYLPGWSLSPSSKPVEKLCQKLTETLNLPAFAVQTIPKNTMPNSLFYEAETIKKMLQEIQPNIKRVVLIAHSQGTIKAIHLASLLQHDTNPKIKGAIFITPVGLYNLPKKELQVRFLGEIIKAILSSIKELLLSKEKSTTHLAFAVLSYIKSEIKTQTLALFSKRLNQQSQELTHISPMISVKLQKMRIPIAFVLAQNDLVSSPKRVKNTLKELGLQRVSVVEKRQANHGLPYTQTDLLIREIEKTVKDFLQSGSGRKTKE